MSKGASSPQGTTLNIVEVMKLTYVLLSCHPLFAWSFIMKLIAIMFIMIICIIYGVSNIFLDELLYILNKYTMHYPNLLLAKIYHAKKLAKKVNHSYESIHVCKERCILFKGEAYKDFEKCPKCVADQYKAHGRSQVPVSILKYFLVIP